VVGVRWRVAVVWVVLFAAAGLWGGGVLDGTEPSGGIGADDRREGDVTSVVDGDTIKVRLTDGIETVRYIGVDTPETVKPGEPVQCFGKAASARNRRLVGGREVCLRVGAEARDRYGRLLAYVYRSADGRFVNAELVRDGYARTLTIRPNDEFARRFERLEAAARRARRGMWRVCPG
jgi:micrococcal nuclease